MRIAFIYPATEFDRLYHAEAMPVGLLSLAAVIEQNGLGEVDMYDARHLTELPSPENVSRYDLVGFTAMSMQISTALRLAQRLRNSGYQGPIAFGGPHASVAPEHLKAQPFIDAVFIGESENTFPEYLAYLEGRTHRLQRIWVRAGGGDGRWTYHPGHDFIEDLNALPFPAREKYGDLAARTRMINMTTTRGCPFQCNYCQPTKQLLFGRKVRRRSVANIIAEVKDAIGKFGIEYFSIDDDTFTFHEKTVREFCEAVRPMKMRWSCQSRSDISRETLEIMRDAGCGSMFVGAESGSQRVLELMSKHNTVESNAQFIRTCNELGIDTWCNMMVGYPGETAEDMEKSLAFVRETQPTRCCVSQVTPFPGTYLWEDNRGDVIEQDWDKVARHIFRPKFRSLAPNQRRIDYYQIVMTKEWGEPLMFDQIERSGWLAQVARKSPFLFHVLMRRWAWLARFVTRKGRRYYVDLNEALARVRGGAVEEGIARLERLARRFPRESEPLGHLGWICLTTGRYDQAIRHLERLLELNPNDKTARSHLERARKEKAGSTNPVA